MQSNGEGKKLLLALTGPGGSIAGHGDKYRFGIAGGYNG